MNKNTFFYLLIIFLTFKSITRAEFKKDNLEKEFNFKELKWDLSPLKNEKNPLWINSPDDKELMINPSKKFQKDIKVQSYGKAISFNSIYYPEISSYVPNAYVQDSDVNITSSTRLISKTRHCGGGNFSEKCSDGLTELDLNILRGIKYSLNTKVSLQSLTNRGTNFGEGISMGFKLAKEISNDWSLAIGGENIIHFDDTIDLGRNFYIVTSTYREIGSKNKKTPPILFLNAGIGSDFYGYKGNGFLGETYCFGGNTLTGDGSDTCSWGPIGSITFAFNDRFAIVNEWFGYSYGSGFSIKPFESSTLNISIFATDFVKGFPKYANESCMSNDCSTRFYGTISLSF
ncbi:hypothetical protein HA147_06935 [Prochlorococcus marinus XMU1410]|uniref:hypothetical protein n=1 Tax=Prochlorococcus marinus TaxID=1219 RepID=UPI001ADBF207|nr:hypothetical protein [Prochlorococcus marinus]MBO8242384.1 hypothetical protein [Prochlorococcus marinus XMU1410]MBW3053532.1 hypothetical protein [Prochlorococcus marinus str. MU1410]